MALSRSSEIIFRKGRLYHLGVAPGELAPNIVQVGDPARAYRVAQRFDALHHEVKNREYVTLTGEIGKSADSDGLPISVIGTGIGTDNVEIALIEAFGALSASSADDSSPHSRPINLIRIGTSGGVQEDVKPGTLSIAEYALGLDSTGLYYDHPSADRTVELIEREASRLIEDAATAGSRFRGRLPVYASRSSRSVFRALTEAARSTDADFASGITVSTSSFYGASGRVVPGLRNSVPGIKKILAGLRVGGLRALNFEMESSLIFHLAPHLGIRAGAICPIISSPVAGGALADYAPVIERSIDIGLAALTSLRSRPEAQRSEGA